MAKKIKITRDDVMPMEQYGALRAGRRKNMAAYKKSRRVHVGPDATFYFESFETMWHQVHEMLFIEGGGDAQINDELNAYNDLIPNGKELVATLMLEVEDAQRRAEFLATMGGVEETVSISLGGMKIVGVAEQDLDRTTADGKASAVQFIHFPFDPVQITAFNEPGEKIILSIDHPSYGHMAAITETVRTALAEDFI
ncbi:MAG: DUF3501 family protein [Rhodospirillales bacterium]|nr:DUF3501 family protein [Rhodospirillales bacterium]